ASLRAGGRLPPPRNAPAREVERRELDHHLVARRNAKVAHAERPGDVRQDLVPVVQVHAEERVRHRPRDRTAHRNRIALHAPASWMAGEISPTWAPGLTASIPAASAACVTAISRSASGTTRPTGTVIAASP